MTTRETVTNPGVARAPPALVHDALFAAGVGVLALAAALLPAVVQDPAYHAFVDRRPLGPIPNAADVLSNAAFALVGAAGLWIAARRPFPDPRARPAWLVLFAAVAATAAGSAWYHLAPTSARLVWDRLPMAIAFMALVAVLAGDRLGPAVGRWALPRLVLVGVASVAWWQAGDGAGQGNLLPYLAVQVGALAAVPVLVLGRPRAGGSPAPWLVALGLYAGAKGLEARDAAVHAALGLSGHTAKHLVAAAAIGVLALHLARGERRGRR